MSLTKQTNKLTTSAICAWQNIAHDWSNHELWKLGEEIALTAWPIIHSHSQIFRYGLKIFCLPHWPKFSGFFDISLYWVSVDCGSTHPNLNTLETLKFDLPEYCGPQTIALDYVICAVDHSRLFLRNRFSESIGDRLTTGH